MSDRTAYTEGLRRLADILDANPDLPLPYSGSVNSELLWIASSNDDHKEAARTFARAIPGTLTKNVRDDAFDLIGNIAGLHVQLIVNRDRVCTRRVVGTETVTLPAVEARPEQTVEREVVEWDCAPLLAEAVAR